MSDTFPVYSALRQLGFVDRGDDGLEFVDRQWELSAVEGHRPWPPADIVSFAGQFSHGDDFGFLEFELPAVVESLEQLKAMLAYNLRHAVRSNVPDWIVEGASQLYLVPEVRKQMEAAAEQRAWEAVYAAREHCVVRREWLKLAIKELSEALKSLEPTAALVTFAFEGLTLSIDCGRRIIVQAEGTAWKQTHAVQAADLATLPKRLLHDRIEIAAYNSRLHIGNHSYPVAEAMAVEDAAK